MSALYPRRSAGDVHAALNDSPVVLVNGPRQSGKTTLVRGLSGKTRPFRTLDDATTLAAASADPVGFIRSLDSATIDEVQRAPDLLLAIKKSIDEDRRPGRFLLTGSTNVLTLPQVSDSLAGRMSVIDLLPLAQTEIAGIEPAFLAAAFDGKPAQPRHAATGRVLEQIVLSGGYPEMLHRKDPARRNDWARNYVHAILQRDVRDIASIEKLGQMPRLLRVLAQHSGQLVNYSQIGGHLGLNDKTARKYLDIFEQLYLVRTLQPWFGNRLKRLIKTPKLHFLDSGLLAAVRGLNAARIAADRAAYGALLETFVFAEIAKLAAWYDAGCQIHHFRDKDQDEVDIVIENSIGEIVGLEVKAAATVTASDFRGLRKLAAACGKAWCCGIVLHDAETVSAFGERLYSAPISSLWAEESRQAHDARDKRAGMA